MTSTPSDINVLFSDLAPNVTVLDDSHGVGVFLSLKADESADRHVLDVGAIANIKRFTVCRRYEPFWMRPDAGDAQTPIPVETQSLIVERTDGTYALYIPLLSGAFSCHLEGKGNGNLQLVAESGDPNIKTDTVVGLFAASGKNLFGLIEASAHSVASHLNTGRLRVEKPLPLFADQFGWCTWDAFYGDVTAEGVQEGLTTFADGGIHPRLLILDDGWQTTEPKKEADGRRLTSFAPNAKFGHDLSPTISMAKDEFGVETFLVWHAIHGYWDGIDGEALPGYGAKNVERRFSPGTKHYGTFEWWGKSIDVIDNAHIYKFYQDYHRELRRQGVDGVKVDNQSSVEGVSYAGNGGRVTAMRSYHEALEGSVHTQFIGNLINCMSCSNDMLYHTLNSTITRTSTDFFPKRPETHGEHLYTNAQVGVWFGEFVHPDWDMFQSNHEVGAFHAAGRAVSGSPVYVSDKPGDHDFALLRKLVLPDGTHLRCSRPGRPTIDCLFNDPTREDVLLKIFNVNDEARAGVVGVFNCQYTENEANRKAISGTIQPSDIDGLEGDLFAVYGHYSGEVKILGANEEWVLDLDQLTAEVFTVVPVEGGYAPIGLIDMFNSSGVVEYWGAEDGELSVALRSGGRFGAYCETEPTVVIDTETGEQVDFTYDSKSRLLTVELSEGVPAAIVVG